MHEYIMYNMVWRTNYTHDLIIHNFTKAFNLQQFNMKISTGKSDSEKPMIMNLVSFQYLAYE